MRWRPSPYLVEFVSSSKERIEQAKQDWKTGRFAPSQRARFIPLRSERTIPFSFSPRVSAPTTVFESSTHDHHACERPAPPADRARQGSRHPMPSATIRVLLLATDRISAFDVVMAETIPMKSAVLTQISAWWFNRLEAVVRTT